MKTTSQPVLIHTMANGLTILGEEMPWLESAALSFTVPAGCQSDPSEMPGLANFACELVQRGAGPFNSRQLLERLELLGVDSTSSVSVYGTHFSAAMPAERLMETLAVYRAILRNPWLPEDQIEDARHVCIQEIRSVEDDLAQRVIQQLRLRQYGEPAGRWSHGTLEGVEAITRAAVADFVERHYRSAGTVLSVAGCFDWNALIGEVERQYGDWEGSAPEVVPDSGQVVGVMHVPFDSQQTHIAVACPALPYRHPDYLLARAGTGVLSDGMSSRLFTGLRERRGLCYTVFATLHSIFHRACVVAYVGTGADRAQQSLDALIYELVHLRKGISAEELRRFQIQLRSTLVMQQESCRSRAGANAGDWIFLGRVRTMDEWMARIRDLEVDQVNRYLAAHPCGNFNVVTLGPEPLDLEHAISIASAG